MTIFYANPEQEALIKLCQSEAAKFSADERLIAFAPAIEKVRALIDKAVEAGLPTQAYVGLQIYVQMHDTEMTLPEHLRTWPSKK